MKKAIILSVLSAMFLSACAGESSSGNSSNVAFSANKPAYSAPATSERSEAKKTDLASANTSTMPGGGGRNELVKQQVSLNQAENSQTPPAAIGRKVVRNADLQMESDAPDQSQQKITSIAESKGGYVVESQQSSSDARTSTRDVVTMTVRVPAEKFGETLEEVRKTANRTVVETVKSDDVTEEFIDIEAKLKANKALEAQFLEIMKRANTVEDALDVQRQLADVRGEIEKIEGRKRFLENQTSFSTLKIRLQTPTTYTENSHGFFDRLGKAFGNGLDAALTFILGLVSFGIAILPFLIFIVLPIYLVVRYFLKKRRKPLTAVEIAKVELKTE